MYLESENVMQQNPHATREGATVPMGAGSKRRLIIFVLAVLGVGGGLGVGVYTGAVANPFQRQVSNSLAAQPTSESTPSVKVIRPKLESSVPIVMSQIGLVEPYYQANLRARASGIVKRMHRDIGDKVIKGDLLVEIDVPESDQDVAKSGAMILQRQQELKVSEAKLKDSKAAKDVSAATIRQREADVVASIATRDFKKRKLDRFKELAAKGSIVGSVVEEEERDFLASEASVTSSKANVERALADFAESESKVEAAAADIELKKAQIEVARRDLDRAKAVADYGKLLAPFDGVVVQRSVDPGSFVQNATSGMSDALISIARVDLVTVSAKIPDSVALFVTKETPVTVQIDDQPGVTISAVVTRFSPTVQNADLTMRIEVDLFNGDEMEYERLVKAVKLGGPDRPTKGLSDRVPIRVFAANDAKARRLLPGMSATISLSLGGFGASYVLPSSAIYTRSGKSYVMLIQDGKTKQVPVRVQLNDGKTVRLAIEGTRKDANGVAHDWLIELTGDEEVVAAKQLEIGNDVSVRSSSSDW